MRFIVRLLAVVGLLFIVLIGAAIFGASRLHVAGRPPTPIADGTVLTLTVEGPFIEESPTRTGLTSLLTGQKKKLREVVGAIDRAAKDSRIKGLVLKIDASAGMAQTQELRAAINRLRAAGKFTYAFADDFDGGGSGNGEYYLAAACDQVWLQPMGQMMLADVAFESPFLKDALSKADIDPEFAKRAEYKTAPETFTERGFTPAAREMMESLANDLTLQMVNDLAASRGLSVEEVRGLLARGPLAADEAVKAKLIDHIGYADEVVAAAKKAAGPGARTVALPGYYKQTLPQGEEEPNIALIYEVGDIGRVEGPIDVTNADRGLDTGNAVMQGFAKATASPSIKAIVFRVDSPGGSVTGSESIRRMVVRAKAAGKKVVVSMGSVAASGGYWISADADKIVAEPATLTGSIGVYSGKFVVAKGLSDIGVTVDRTAAGPFAGMDSPFAAFTPDQSQKLNASIDKVYDGFIQRVADGRKMPAGAIAQSAKGRVWSGQQAKQLGLVDELGGLDAAFLVARDVAGIAADQPTVIRIYPEPLTPFDTVRAILSGDSDIKGEITEDAGSVLADLDGPAGRTLRLLVPLFRASRSEIAKMPDIGTVK